MSHRNRGNDDPLLVGIILFVVGLATFIAGLRAMRRRRLFQNTPTSKIRSLAMGPVEVSGAAKVWKQTLTSPLMQKACVWYDYAIEKLVRRGKRSVWEVVSGDRKGAPFLVRDETGSVLVDSKGAEIAVPKDYFVKLSGFKRTPPSVQAIFDRLKVQRSFSWFGGSSYRLTERYIAPDDRLFVFGTAGDNPFVAETHAQGGVEDTMIQKTKEAPFFISDRSQKEILSGLAWRTWGSLIAGTVLIVVGLLIILNSPALKKAGVKIPV